MPKTTVRTLTLLAVTAATAAALGLPAASAASPAPTPPTSSTADLTGTARMDFPMPGNDIEVTVDAHATYTQMSPSFPVTASGTVRISHRTDASNGQTPSLNWGVLAVDCVSTGGPTATVTGILVDTTPGGPWQDMLNRHIRMGVSLYLADKAGRHAGPSRIGLAPGAVTKDMPELPKCMAPAAGAAVVKGGFKLRGGSLW